MNTDENGNLRILSIDAWREGDSWTWNNWFYVGDIHKDCLNWSTRKLLKYFRDEGFLAESSVRRVGVNDDQYNIVLLDRRTLRPLYAIEYGGY